MVEWRTASSMAIKGRPKAVLVLSDGERETLQRWARRTKSAQVLALQCRIVLACAEGKTSRRSLPMSE